MRKWLWIGAASLVLGGVGVCWHAYLDVATRLDMSLLQARGTCVLPRCPKDDSETCEEVFEPLVVDGRVPPPPTWVPAPDDMPLPRVVLAPGTQQPPRPDAEFGAYLRMPYADEEDDTPVFSLERVLQFVQSTVARLNVFGQTEPQNPSEESENGDVPMPEAVPEAVPTPAMDYHRQFQHCPYSGGCPYYHR